MTTHPRRISHLLAATLVAFSAAAQAAPDYYGPRNTIPREPLARSVEPDGCTTTLRVVPGGLRPHFRVAQHTECAVTRTPARLGFVGPRMTIPSIN